jgi:hypothetical protein
MRKLYLKKSIWLFGVFFIGIFFILGSFGGGGNSHAPKPMQKKDNLDLAKKRNLKNYKSRNYGMKSK